MAQYLQNKERLIKQALERVRVKYFDNKDSAVSVRPKPEKKKSRYKFPEKRRRYKARYYQKNKKRLNKLNAAYKKTRKIRAGVVESPDVKLCLESNNLVE